MTEEGSGESKVIAEMTPEQLRKAIVEEQPKMRVFAIETDGHNVRVTKNDLTPLEVRAVCLMLLKQLGG